MKRIYNLVNKCLVPSENPLSEANSYTLKIDLPENSLRKLEGDKKTQNLTEDNNNTDKRIPSIKEEKTKPYFALMLKPNCDLLLRRFMTEISTLRMSDARETDFSFESSLSRLRKGYTVIEFNYTSSMPTKAHIAIDGYGILIKSSGSLEQRFNYEEFRGVLLGPLSSTFQWYFRHGGKLKHLALEDTDCFSVLGEFQNFDFATHSDTAKYDIMQVVSFYLSSRGKNSCPILPIKHSNIVIYKVRHKIHEMACRRFMTVKELLLLAILKSLIINHAPSHMVERIRMILNSSFSGSSRLFRVSVMMKPSEFHTSGNFNRNYKDTLRKIILAKRKGYRISDNLLVVKTPHNKEQKDQRNMLTRVLLMNKRKEEWDKIKDFLVHVE